MTKNLGVFAAAALAIVAFTLAPSGVMAQSFSGSFPLTWNISFGHAGTHTYCLTLTDNGSAGFPHSGPATVTGNYIVTRSEGVFQFINNELVALFYVPGGEEIGDVVFVGPALNSQIGKGFGQYAASGAFTDLGPLTFGEKGGCGDAQ